MHEMHMVNVGFRISKENLEELNRLVADSAYLNTNRSELVNTILSLFKMNPNPQKIETMRKYLIENRKAREKG